MSSKKRATLLFPACVILSIAATAMTSDKSAALAASASTNSEEKDPAAKLNQLAGDPKTVELGRQVYGNTCLFCHGPNGVGARAPNLIEGMFKPGRDGEVPYAYDVIQNGRPGTIMGSFKDTISDDEIWQVMAYLRDQGQQVIDARKKKRSK